MTDCGFLLTLVIVAHNKPVPRPLLRSLYDWTMDKARHPKAIWWLAGVSFAESSFFPIPPDVMLVPMVLADRRHAWRIAGVCLIASVLGGLLGYYIGFALLESVGQWIISLYGMQEGLENFRDWYTEWGLWVILIMGATPIPYKIVTIASGMANFSLPVFIIASLVTRGIRFYLVAGLLYWFGEPIRAFIERRLTLVTTVFVVALVGGFAALKYVF
jgi:membrane protein YqaA with SNARE-associated domain